jgi:hypothetical protein
MTVNIAGFDLGINLPTFSATGIGYWLIIGLVVVLFLASGGIIFYIIYTNRVFNKRIVVFENIAGQGYQITGQDKAKIIKVGDGGEEVLYLRKRKVYRTAYGRKMGTNTYWFAVGQDGYWYNVLLGDLDAKMGMLDIEPIDRDMRYMHVAIRKNIADRYKGKKMEKITAIVVGGIVLVCLILVIGGYFIMKQLGESAKLTGENIKALKPMADTLNNVAGRLDTICSGGSGIRASGG